MPWRLILLTRGVVTEAQLEEARGEVERGIARPACGDPWRNDLGAALVRLGYADEEQVAQARAAEAGCNVHRRVDSTSHRMSRQARGLLPAALLDLYGAAVVDVDRKGGRLVLGFVLRQEPALLRAIAAVTGLRAEGCFLTPCEYERRREPLDAREVCRDTGVVVTDDVGSITAMVVEQAMRAGADRVHLARISNRLWLRLSGELVGSLGGDRTQQTTRWPSERGGSPDVSRVPNPEAGSGLNRVADRIFVLRPRTSAEAVSPFTEPLATP